MADGRAGAFKFVFILAGGRTLGGGFYGSRAAPLKIVIR